MATRYTQQMADDGVEMGKGHIVIHHQFGEVELLLDFDGRWDSVIMIDGKYDWVDVSQVEPLPNPPELIDGSAYVFDINGERVCGIYCNSDETLTSNRYCLRYSRMKNITRLVPEVK